MKSNKILNAEALLLCVGLVCFNAWGNTHYKIEVYGDSLSAGFLDETQLTNAPTLAEVGKIVSDLALYKIGGNRAYVTAHENRDLAWPQVLAHFISGTEPGSVASVDVENLAVSGAKSEDLLSEIPQEDSRLNANLAFFFIGHNDLCENPQTPEQLAATYRGNYEKGLAAWDSTHKNAAAYLVPLAEIQKLYEILDGTVWHEAGAHAYTCEDSWTHLFPYCTSYYQLFKEGKLNDFIVPRIEAMRGALRDLASEWDRKSTRGNRFQYLDGLETLPYATSYFAVDCYHLSTEGQEQFGRHVFESILKP